MIYQFYSEQGTGLIMLSDGEKKEFSITDWVDNDNAPGVAQKIAYIESHNRIEIRKATEEDEILASSAQKEESSEEALLVDSETPKFDSIEDCIRYYTDGGFKIVKEMTIDRTRTVTLRFYTPTDYGEAVIKHHGSKISVTQTINGQASSYEAN